MTAPQRLNKVLAAAGVASRRAADELIRNGRIQVNGKVVTELGTKVDPEVDTILLDGESVGQQQPKVTVVLKKPHSVMTTMDDPETE